MNEEEDNLEERINEIIEIDDTEAAEEAAKAAAIEDATFKSSYDDPDALLKTLETFYMMESESILNVIEESRELMKFSMLKLHEEQEDYKKKFVGDLEKKYALKRREENAIPLAEYVRRKKEMLNMDAPRKKIEFDDDVPQTEREAIRAYFDRKAKTKRDQRSAQLFTNQSANIMSNMRSVGQAFEKEKHKQNEFMSVQDPSREASAIMSNFKRTESAIQNEKKAQEDKINLLLENKRGGQSAKRVVPDIDC